MELSIKEIKSQVNIVDVIGRYIFLKKNGAQYVGLCPFHKDSSASLQVSESKQIFCCFACSAKGDVLDFITKQGKTLKEAIKEIKDPNNLSGKLISNTPYEKPQPTQIWTPINPAPFFQRYAQPRFFHHKHGEPDNIYTYHKLDGNIWAYVCRFNLPDGKKEVLPFTYCSNGEREDWRWRGIVYPRPLYNLHLLSRQLPVLISEGEKTCDALHVILGDRFNCITWIGGCEGILNADWTPIKSRELLLWPDNDEPGIKAMNNIASLLSPLCPKIKTVRNPSNAEKGWDFADSGWDYNTTIAYLKENIYVK